MNTHTPVIETLLLPFAEGALPVPDHNSAFFIRAQHSPEMDPVWKEKLICEQTIKGDFDELKRAGFQTVTKLEEKADMGMCLLTKHKKENYGNIARAWDLLSPGGTLLCAGSNDIGVKSFEKNVRKEIPVSGNMHKNHCRVFWMKKEEDNPALYPQEWSSFNRPGKYIKDADYFTRPGIFCWEKVDKGSAFLAEHLPRKVKGKVADFGSGWGYLSHHILDKYPDLTELDLYEDELLALDVSRENLEQLKLTERAKFHWYDLAGDPPKPDHYNWIISNPPFHRSARTDVSLGIKFIENAARSLKRSGSLLLVANRQLPYEKALSESFKKTERLAESPECKILLATVPIKR